MSENNLEKFLEGRHKKIPNFKEKLAAGIYIFIYLDDGVTRQIFRHKLKK
ncbi:MAG: hypothetical protein GF335_01000, partial [Candidatus Moranbacteria bacterium]|nr:hypothetical protein [Candidatus Moranbacteria bacterium]